MKSTKQSIAPWWIMLISSVLAVLFGIISLAWPQASLALMLLFFGIWALIHGVISIVRGFASMKIEKHWWIATLEGALSVFVGLFIFFDPRLSITIAYLMVAGWAILMGILQIIGAFVVLKGMVVRWFLAAMGAFSLILGILLIANYTAGLTVFVWMVGVFALFYGIFGIALALGLRETNKKLEIKK